MMWDPYDHTSDGDCLTPGCMDPYWLMRWQNDFTLQDFTDCKTYANGRDPKKPCVFPYIWQGVTYYTCKDFNGDMVKH